MSTTGGRSAGRGTSALAGEGALAAIALRCHASCGQVAQRDCESMLATRFICARKFWHVEHRGEIRQRSAALTFAVRAHTPHQRRKYESWLVEEILTNVRRSTAGPSLRRSQRRSMILVSSALRGMCLKLTEI